MSALAWLFGLGALTIAFPFLFHLIRRTPRGQTEFSSLMFLKPSPPTLTRRSRLENLLLLFMRALAIGLIAFAFMRPFFRGNDSLTEFDVANRRIAILLDTSASMRRAGLWDQAQQKIDETLDGLEEGDSVALITFDQSTEAVVDFDTSALNLGSQKKLILEKLKSIEPTWARSDLGQALVSVADSLDIWRDSQRSNSEVAASRLQIVVISDLQKGSRIESLQSFQWPTHVFVRIVPVVPEDYSNATVQLLDRVPEEDDPSLRIRIANSEESKVEQFVVSWTSDSAKMDPVNFYVPPATSRVLKISPDDALNAREFTVSGDREDFDNTFFTAPVEVQELNVAYVGEDDPNDPEQLQFYLKRALIDTPSRALKLRHVKIGESIFDANNRNKPTLLVITSPVDESQRDEITNYVDSGGTALFVLNNDEITQNTSSWTGASVDKPLAEDAKSNSRDNYLMLAEIDFSNPLFQPFANPRYNDFTRIRFWQHQPVVLNEDANVIARFDNDAPAVWERLLPDAGRIIVLASGWQPQQSQLALSTKFVPLITGLIEIAADLPELKNSLLVNDRLEFPKATGPSIQRRMIMPDGIEEIIDAGQTSFQAEQPGIYRLVSQSPETDEDANQFTFAVNVDRAESQTAMIPVERLEMFDVNIGEQQTASSELAQMRAKRDRDIENDQQIWKWLIVAAIILLIAETWLAGRTAQRMTKSKSAFSSSTELSGEVT